MIRRMSTMFLHTLREEPADAEVPSHRLLVRAGYVRRLAPGIYSWLPLGKQVLDNVASVVREEMDALGGQEVLFPALLPREFYEATGRERGYGDLLFRVTDRRGGHYVLGPTHEELFTAMVKGECSSYRDLPLTLYQIQAKYRDEARPRAGLLRGREFVMKDSYSFDLDEDGLQDSYNRHRAAYMRIFNRLGLDYRVVRAVAGAMGGTHSEQFLAPSPSGEDTYVCCTTCDFAANTEAVPYRPGASQRGAHGSGPHPPMRVLDTPAAATIEALSARLRLPAAAMLKNLLVTVTEPDGRTATVGIGVPGDREVDLRRVEAALAPAVVRAYTEQDFAARPELVRGHVGPQGLAGSAFRYLADPRVAVGTSWVTGANEPDRHVRDAVVGRDFTVDRYVDVVAVRDEDPCPSCGGSLRVDRGIEVGHIFQLGRRYADVFDLDVLGPDGRQVRVTMGSYGIGLSRLVAAIAEQTFDDDGLCWPATVAPADVHVVAAGRDDTVHAAAAGLADQLAERGNRVILDDRRAVSAGVKFTDAELIGVPVIVVVGRGLADGTVEVRHRRTGRRCAIAPTEVAEAVNRRVEAG